MSECLGRNGHSSKVVPGDFGPIPSGTPRDRDGPFEPPLVAEHPRRRTGSTTWARWGSGLLTVNWPRRGGVIRFKFPQTAINGIAATANSYSNRIRGAGRNESWKHSCCGAPASAAP
ncbi:hypothetical protein PX52LOC_04102 [Limnoglobus roseus]|uniref:Uncharacterized protein n=1 Tax=Limnoglobus roseus TaxID=2598579 RepID=A0A5C1ACU7_9BACT|nr:hypothetical protein PX52LOC_04102 [Limnoglobus roseus]